jgi:hypothetical protein
MLRIEMVVIRLFKGQAQAKDISLSFSKGEKSN